MADITKSDGQLVVYSTYAINGATAVTVNIPQLSIVTWARAVATGAAANAVAVKCHWTTNAVVMTPYDPASGEAATAGTGVYAIEAWGY